MARPTSLTPELQQRLCDAIRDGNYYESACSLVEISFTTFRSWILRGEKAKSGPFFEFLKAVKKAEADAEAAVVGEWRAQIPENWQAARDFLARRFPERWGQRDTLTILKKVASEMEGMSDEELIALVGRRGDQGETGADHPATAGSDSTDHPGPGTAEG